ncbi:phosphatidylinositol-specific phospholipase C1-like protein [Adhaeribacter pallidiroseus]|uniref:Histone-lysine N-methyltransferase n=1 Tax=Adhaeribacter pallidiroseus TaxID=2072847 RepID=A0A369QAB8_9BACT|nr:phosphatidylinositol-specific phospholipase C1-like protein [Adhaeribacter pallidiroseus]RDC61853.1 Histone-lysine N-methyltransferase [Adhaeribacter pallidiroseus]
MKNIAWSLILTSAIGSFGLTPPKENHLIQATSLVNHKKYLVDVPSADNLPLNQIQVIGSHNSYKQPLDPPVYQMLKKADSTLVKAIDYSHLSLSEQLDRGLLNLEIDIYADVKGSKYANPKGLEWSTAGQVKPFDPEGIMREPGFKVMHIQDIDFRSNCLTFKNCLQELKSWSEKHPNHLPVFITVNAKDEALSKPGFTIPEKFTAEVYDLLDKTIQDNLGSEKLLTPDMVRGKSKTLETAILQKGWPKVGTAKGKFVFILDETGPKRATYIQNHPSLQGRVLFANAEPGTPEAAFLILNDPKKDLAKIQELAKKGYLIRTRADANTVEARSNDKSTFEAACKSGAQIISTDYYLPSTHFKSDYQISFPDQSYCRLNPVTVKK